MSPGDPCCQRLEPGESSPFDIVALGYYDGATSGVAQCRACQRAYHFELLHWDDEQAVRVYGLLEIPEAAYHAIKRLQASPVAEGDALIRGNELMLAVRDATAGSFERDLIVATEDLAREILSARRLTFNDWAAILMLPRRTIG